jgi:hypothetical protein
MNEVDFNASSAATNVAKRIVAFVERYVRDDQQAEAAHVIRSIVGEAFKAGADAGVGAVKEVMERFGIRP